MVQQVAQQLDVCCCCPLSVGPFTHELAELKLCPGNEAHRYAETITKLVHQFDAEGADVTEQIMSDDIDIEELLRNDQAIMGGIVQMSKLVTAMHDMLKREFLQEGRKSGEDTDSGSTGKA